VRALTAQDAFHAVHEHFDDVDVAISAAAVADYRPVQAAKQKIKKQEGEGLEIQLERTKDILKSMGEAKTKQFLVGFALETQNALENAKTKLTKKNLDAIVLNTLEDNGAGFGSGTNKITFLDKNLAEKTFEVKPKEEVASDIWSEIIARIHA